MFKTINKPELGGLSLDGMRQKFMGWLQILSIIHIVVGGATCWATGSDPMRAMILLGALSAIAFIAAKVGRSSLSRIVMAVILQAQAAVLVALLAGHHWQPDAHMYFFAVMGILVMLVDIPALLAAAATVAVHHLAFNFFAANLVFPGESDFFRVVLHAVILIAETAALIVVTLYIDRILAEATTARRSLEAELDQTERLREKTADVENKAKQAQARTIEALHKSFGDVVESALCGDFSKRVEDEFEEEKLQAIAQSMNKLTRTIDCAVSSANDALSAIAVGDLNARMDGAFEGRLADLKNGIHGTASQLAILVEEIQGLSGDIASSSSSIFSQAEEMSSQTTRQSASVESSVVAMDEVTHAVRANTESVEEMLLAAKDVTARAALGRDVVRDATAAMATIETGSSGISTIVEVIEGIAFQTNLLALNAAVEAARAGDAGKGFAIVATEVRTLAQRSAGAANDIKSLIETSNAQVDRGVTFVGRTGDALSDILQAIDSLSQSVKDISNTTNAQSEQVTTALTSIKELDENTRKYAFVAEESARSADTLTTLSSKLSDLVFRFETSRTGPDVEADQDANWSEMIENKS